MACSAIGDIVECRCGCGHLFRVKVDGQRFWGKSCARRWQAEQQRVIRDQPRIDALMQAIEVEVRKALGHKE
jgi:hypothetical protein